MSKSGKRIFYQDFLFKDIPVDENEFPDIQIQYVPREYDLSGCICISLDCLFRMDHEREWEELFSRISNSNVCIIDDVFIENEEMEFYKEFYLKTYCCAISSRSNSCIVRKAWKQMRLF